MRELPRNIRELPRNMRKLQRNIRELTKKQRNIKSLIETLFENKTATLGINGSYQFNAFRKDKNFTHLFCLGIAPNEICYVIISKDNLYNEMYTREHYDTVPISLYNKKNTKDGQVDYGKLTINKKYMKPISELVNDLKSIL